eukprot:1160114-Pelagomonas_calceolata.AAC.23
MGPVMASFHGLVPKGLVRPVFYGGAIAWPHFHVADPSIAWPHFHLADCCFKAHALHAAAEGHEHPGPKEVFLASVPCCLHVTSLPSFP